MKKALSVMLALLFVAASGCLSAYAYDVPGLYMVSYKDGYNSFEYAMEGNTYYVRSYSADEGVLCGWSKEENGKIAFNPGEVVTVTESMTLWPVLIDPILGGDEIFYFNNSSWYFETEDYDGYYMNDADKSALQRNLWKTFGIGPFPTPVLSIVLATLPKWDWQGSCYGISTVTALQHFGIINVLDIAEDAECMLAVEPDDALRSFINYWQANAATSWLTENKSARNGNAKQLKAMYEAVKAGKLTMFTFYQDKAFVSTGHTVLLTAAFDDKDGNHVIITYDCNSPSTYYNGYYSTRLVIAPDYSSATYRGDSFGAFNWTSNFEQFESFLPDGTGKTAHWYNAFFAHIKEMFSIVF